MSLAIVRPGLEAIGFNVEKSKRADDLVAVPVLYGINGKIEKSFEADGYLQSHGSFLLQSTSKTQWKQRLF